LGLKNFKHFLISITNLIYLNSESGSRWVLGLGLGLVPNPNQSKSTYVGKTKVWVQTQTQTPIKSPPKKKIQKHFGEGVSHTFPDIIFLDHCAFLFLKDFI